MRRSRGIGCALLAVVVAGCGMPDGVPDRAAAESGAVAATDEARADEIVVVEERWISEANVAWDLDTPALWTDGSSGRVLVTGKGSHDLRVFDGATGATLETIGHPGSELGAFDRPNAVLVVDDFALVVERDNARVQVLALPGGTSLGSFGEGVLDYPYGAAMLGSADDLVLWVTDDYEVLDGEGADYTRRLHRFEVVLHDGAAPEVRGHRTAGEAAGPGALAVVESIQTDPERGILFVADESKRSYLGYDDSGAFNGSVLARGHVDGDPEGIGLVRCGDGGGYWLVADQQADVSIFRLFDRATGTYVGSFRGTTTANTDGLSFEPGPVPGFPGGVLYAVHDDQALSAFDWSEVAIGLGLEPGCGMA